MGSLVAAAFPGAEAGPSTSRVWPCPSPSSSSLRASGRDFTLRYTCRRTQRGVTSAQQGQQGPTTGPTTLASLLVGTHRSRRPWKSCSTRSSLCPSGVGRPSSLSSTSLLVALRSKFTCNGWRPALMASSWGQKGGGAEIQQTSETTFYKDPPYARLMLGAKE